MSRTTARVGQRAACPHERSPGDGTARSSSDALGCSGTCRGRLLSGRKRVPRRAPLSTRSCPVDHGYPVAPSRGGPYLAYRMVAPTAGTVGGGVSPGRSWHVRNWSGWSVARVAGRGDGFVGWGRGRAGRVVESNPRLRRDARRVAGDRGERTLSEGRAGDQPRHGRSA